ncbi:MAG TPA: lysophospholipid acyltransferase family protein [Minicystis sp.]|nr:lysophospholipid acyltransferase family protein [Minicystis sp.]
MQARATVDAPAGSPLLRALHGAAYTLGCSERAMIEKALGGSDAKVQQRTREWARGFGKRMGITVRATGLDAIDWSRPCIVMANHQSYLDVFALYRTLPNAFGFVAKKALFAIPAFGGVMRGVGCIPVDRGNRSEAIASMKEAASHVRGGKTICVFPEGTRGPGDVIQPFKKGSFYLAQFAGVPVVPIGITGTAALMPRSNRAIYPGEVEVRAGEPIAAIAEDDAAARKELARRVRTELSRLTGLPLAG